MKKNDEGCKFDNKKNHKKFKSCIWIRYLRAERAEKNGKNVGKNIAIFPLPNANKEPFSPLPPKFEGAPCHRVKYGLDCNKSLNLLRHQFKISNKL